MDLRQIEYFVTASHLNSITRAAERLHTSQPNISIAIQRLESNLGIQLFDRHQKKLVLTPEGQVFLERMEVILNYLNDALIEMNDYKNFKKGYISIGIPPMIGSFLFPAIFSRFRTMYPGVELSVLEDGSLSIRDRIASGDLDLGIVILTNAAPELSMLPVTTQQIMVCLPQDHPLSSKAVISITDLRDQPLILLKENSYHRHIVIKECERHHIKPRIILSTNQIEGIKGLVANGVGISFLFEVIASKETNIVSRPLVDPLFVDIGLAWKTDRYLSNASRAFIEFIDGYSKNIFK